MFDDRPDVVIVAAGLQRMTAAEIDTVPSAATGVVTVDLDAVAANWRALAQFVAPAECGAVVKANAYGLGAARVIPTLRRAGCRTFFVATANEGAEARALAPDAAIFALDGLLPGALEVLVANTVYPVLGSIAEVRDAAAFAKSSQRPIRVALHLDSGLNRLGLSLADVRDVISGPGRLHGIDVQLVMSHLACADEPDHPKNATQRKAFDAIRALLPATRASLAASDGLMLGKAFHYGLVRPGYALYGGQAFMGAATPVVPVISVHARILQIRDVEAAETVGYAAAWTAQRDSKIAIVAAGYADGFQRAATIPGPRMVKINGSLAPVIGRVSMDLIAVDVTDLPTPPQRGGFAMLVGEGLPIERAAAESGTIGYEVLTSLSNRFHRVYREASSHG